FLTQLAHDILDILAAAAEGDDDCLCILAEALLVAHLLAGNMLELFRDLAPVAVRSEARIAGLATAEGPDPAGFTGTAHLSIERPVLGRQGIKLRNRKRCTHLGPGDEIVAHEDD